jgi:hypothetical protein
MSALCSLEDFGNFSEGSRLGQGKGHNSYDHWSLLGDFAHKIAGFDCRLKVRFGSFATYLVKADARTCPLLLQ